MLALVTGGTGFVGSAVARALLDKSVAVRCLVRATSDRHNLEGLDVELFQGDLLDAAAMRRCVKGCHQVYHVAAYYSTRANDAGKMFAINVKGARNVLRAAIEAGTERIVHTSTIGTIGQPTDDRQMVPRLANEDDVISELERASPYVRSKLSAEAWALEQARKGAPIVVVNPCAPVGPRDVVPSSTGQRIVDYLHGRLPSFSPGGINFCAVEDVAIGHFLAAQRGRVGHRYILGNTEGNLLLEDFYALMERTSGVPRPQGDRPSWLGRLRRALRDVRSLRRASGDLPPEFPSSGNRPSALTADPSRAVTELGMPQTQLEVAFRNAVDWFRENGYVSE